MLLLVSFGPRSAWAHAVLVDSQPAPESHVPAGAVSVMLRYNSRVDARRSKLTLQRPDGTRVRLAQDPGGAPDILRTHLTLTPGAYTIRWQVLATDGHITRGTVPFTVTAP